MMTHATRRALIERLKESGLLPRFCTRFEFRMIFGERDRLLIECYAEEGTFEKIVDALTSDPKVAQEIAREVIFVHPVDETQRARVDIP